MAYGYYGFKPYVPAGVRRARAARELAALRQKGRSLSPVVVEGRRIAETFWGDAWCDNLERYSDFANRLPRGRTYVRNGSVVDLQVEPGRVAALVSGSAMYAVNVTVGAVPGSRWRAICGDCSGAIDSLVELLQGRFSKGVMARLCDAKTGLFPSPKEIRFTCSCPDWASMCKHVAAVLYGIGARLDQQPELLFTLRNVDSQDMIAKAGSGLSKTRKGPAGAKVLATDDDLSEMFGIDMAPAAPARRVSASVAAPKRSAVERPGASSGDARVSRPKLEKPASKGRRKKPGLTPAKRRSIAERMRKLWAARRARKPTG